MRRQAARVASLLLLVTTLVPWAQAGDRPLTFTDLMKLRTIDSPTISEDGSWVAYAVVPDRGDGQAVARSFNGETVREIERGSNPVLSGNARWMAAMMQPTLEERETAEEEDPPEPGAAVVSLETGETRSFERVKSFAFSDDGRWLAVHHEPEEKDEEEDQGAVQTEGEEESTPEAEEESPATEEEVQETEEAQTTTEAPPETEGVPQPVEPTEPPPEEVPPPEKEPTEDDEKEDDQPEGSLLILLHLDSADTTEIPHVTSYAFDEPSRFLAYATDVPDEEDDGNDAIRTNGLYLRVLGEESTPERVVTTDPHGRYEALTWLEEASLLAFNAAVHDPEEDLPEPVPAALWIYDAVAGTGGAVATSGDAPEGWFLPAVNELAWSEDGERLFFGLKPEDERVEPKDEKGKEEDEDEGEEEVPFEPYDTEAILEDRELDVWHGDDPLIVPHQKARWEEEKNRTYRAVLHRSSGDVVPLADRTLRRVETVDNPSATLGWAEAPYLRQLTWDGWYADLYRVDLGDGSRQLVAERLDASPFSSRSASMSPDGRFVAYWRTPHWHLFDGATGQTRTLTEGLDVPFANEDHDYPDDPSGYGVAGWIEDDAAVLVYDKYDLWRFPTDPAAEPVHLTAGQGRDQERIFRVLDLEPEEDEQVFGPGERLLLSSYHDENKNWGFYEASTGSSGVNRLLEDDNIFTYRTKAEKAPRILYTRESYREFPDLWTADLSLQNPRRLTEVNPEIADFAWGRSRLVSWTSPDGHDLQGVLITPEGWQTGDEPLPVLVYFYRFFSQRLHEFNPPHVNHRPSFPVYASHGYAVFLPDVRFEVGRPGLSAVKALTSGVQHLVDSGVADPQRIGLHGHSWSGYQTAFVVTQTDAFAAAVAGAPVSNMTSAYTGIRRESGLARMFQYEMSQSRLGVSMWEGRDRYVENSPVFYADRIDTPLLIQFGDADGAVPWEQGIELYLAMRRLDKDVIFLQYRGEPHHLEKYANKLDYSIKMKQFFDHHLKGEPAPEWMTEGVPYRGE